MICVNEEHRQWRASMYAMLGNLFAQSPSQEILDYLMGGLAVPPPVAEKVIIVGLCDALKHSAATCTLRNIQDEYHRLFIGVTGGEIMPYASWYLTGFLMEKPLAALRSDLRELGIARQQKISEPEDHVAALFESMSLLIQENNSVQAAFFKTHMAPWIERFFADLNKSDSAEFYRAVGMFSDAFIRLDKDYLEVLDTAKF